MKYADPWYLFGLTWFDSYNCPRCVNSTRAKCARDCTGWWFIYDPK